MELKQPNAAQAVAARGKLMAEAFAPARIDRVPAQLRPSSPSPISSWRICDRLMR